MLKTSAPVLLAMSAREEQEPSGREKKRTSGLGKGFSFVRGNLLVLIASWMCFNFVFGVVFPYETLYMSELGATPFVIGLLAALGQALLFTSRIIGGYVADKYGRRDIIVSMTFGVAISYAFYAIAPDWRLIAFGIVMNNLCLLYQPALQAITADSIPPEKRGMGFALANVLPQIPSMFAPLVAKMLIEEFGFLEGMRIAYWLVVLGSLVAADIRLLFLKETLETGEKIRARELVREFKRSVREMFNALKVMPRQLKIFTIIMLISVIEEPVFHLFMSLYVVNVIGVSKPDWALISMAWSITMLAIGIPLGKAVDIIGRKRALIMAYFFWIPSTWYFIFFCKSFLELIVIMVIFSFGGGLFNPAHQALVADLTPKEMRGRIMGAVGNLNIIAAAGASALAGFLYGMNPRWPFILTIGISVITLLLTALFIKEPKRKME